MLLLLLLMLLRYIISMYVELYDMHVLYTTQTYKQTHTHTHTHINKIVRTAESLTHSTLQVIIWHEYNEHSNTLRRIHTFRREHIKIC